MWLALRGVVTGEFLSITERLEASAGQLEALVTLTWQGREWVLEE